MGLTLTLALAAAAFALALFCGWRSAKPFDPRKGPRMFPHRMVMLLSAACGIYLLVHVANLLGFHTGPSGSP